MTNTAEGEMEEHIIWEYIYRNRRYSSFMDFLSSTHLYIWVGNMNIYKWKHYEKHLINIKLSFFLSFSKKTPKCEIKRDIHKIPKH